MNSPQQDSQNLKISSPDKVSRLLEKAGQTGLPLLIRSLSDPTVAVRGCARPSVGPVALHGFRVSNISERGIEFLVKNGSAGIQVEFALSSAKLMFYSSISHFSKSDCMVTFPDCLTSVERRKNARFPAVGSQRAFVSLSDWRPSQSDPGVPPYFESSRDMVRLLPVADMSLGGLSVAQRFPGVFALMGRSEQSLKGTIHLPMVKPLDIEVSIRWHRKTQDVVSELDGASRAVTVYRFGVMFSDPSDELLDGVRSFIQLIAHSEAI